MPVPHTHFYMIRHGETEANASRIMAGSLDSPLTDNGRRQAYEAQKAVRDLSHKPVAIVHSHLSRARDTASILNEALDLPMHEDEGFAELHAGDWEGVPYEECPDLLTGWPDPPNGEIFDDFMHRIRLAKNRHLEKYGGPVLIVSHGGVFRAFGKLYGLDIPGSIENCHLHEFHPDQALDPFPWQSWQYDLHLDVVQRRPAKNFIKTTKSEVASR